MKGKRAKTTNGSAASSTSSSIITSASSILGRIREVEQGVVDGRDLQHMNGLTELLGHVRSLLHSEDEAAVADEEEEEEGKKSKSKGKKEAKEGREAGLQSMHALRRIFLALVKRGDVRKPLATAAAAGAAVTSTTANGKKKETKGNEASSSSSSSSTKGRKRARDTDNNNNNNNYYEDSDDDDKEEDALDEFHKWIYGQYQAFLSLLLDLIGPSSPSSLAPSSSSSSSTLRVQAAALRTIMEFVKIEGVVRRKPFRCFGHDLFYRLVARLVSSSSSSSGSSSSSSSSSSSKGAAKKEKQAQAQAQAELMEVLRVDYILPYCDVRYWLLKSLRALAGREGGKEGGKEGQEGRTAAMLKLLMLVTVEKEEADMVSFWVSFAGEEGDGALVPKEQEGMEEGGEEGEEGDFDFMGGGFGDDDENEDEEEEGREGAASAAEKIPHVARLSEHRKALGEAWIACLRLPSFTPSLYRSTTQFVARHVLERMPHPLQLADFFTASYAQGGLTALVALEGLFVLMQAHNLEYPRFYSSLYRLLAPGPQVLYSRHRARFFRLLRLCLVSPAVPAHIVAAFLKRLCRLSLLAPPPSIIFLLSLLVVVLRAHPACLALIQRVFTLDKASAMRLDTFDPNAEDPATAFQQQQQQQQQQKKKSKKTVNNDLSSSSSSISTIQTSLWEVAALRSHYHPSVAMLAKGLEVSTPEDPKTLNPFSTDMDELASYTYTDLFIHEGKQRRKVGKEEEAGGGGGRRRRGGKEGGGEGGVALAFEKMARPEKLFQPGDVFDGLFALPPVPVLE